MPQGIEAVENVLRYFAEQLGYWRRVLRSNCSRSRESQQEAGRKNNLAHNVFSIPGGELIPNTKQDVAQCRRVHKYLAARLLRLFRLLFLLILVGIGGFIACDDAHG